MVPRIQESAVSNNKETGSREIRTRTSLVPIAAFIFALIPAGIQAWSYRLSINSDGLHYLDHGDAFFSGNWGMALNTLRSPLYPLLLGAANKTLSNIIPVEPARVHLVSMVIYIFALSCFYLLIGEVFSITSRNQQNTGGGKVFLSRGWFFGVLTLIFVYYTLWTTPMYMETPDILTEGFVFLSLWLLIRWLSDDTNPSQAAWTGVIFGLGFLAKAPLFPLAGFWIAVASVHSLRRRSGKHLLYLLVGFVISAGPFIGAISFEKGRFTFSDSGRLNYAWHVNGVTPYYDWDGKLTERYDLDHPVRQIWQNPEIYEYGEPVGGTNPLTYDPIYWYEGLSVQFDMQNSLYVFCRNTFHLVQNNYRSLVPLLLIWLVVFLTAKPDWKKAAVDLRLWVLFTSAALLTGMMLLVHMELRYISASYIMAWLVLFWLWQYTDTLGRNRTLAAIKWAGVIVFSVLICLQVFRESVNPFVARIRRGQDGVSNALGIASFLIENGIQEGDNLALVGDPLNLYWARAAGVRVIAHLPIRSAETFYALSDLEQEDIYNVLQENGIRAIVSKQVSEDAVPEGWQKLEGSTMYLYIFE